MTTTSTHDTKRGEDAAARLAVLSELPERFARSLDKLRALQKAQPGCSAGDAYLFHQTLISTVPFGWNGRAQRPELRARLSAYMSKAAREAKLHTSWIRQNTSYEASVQAFVAGALAHDGYCAEVAELVEQISSHGASNSLAQTLLRTCCPGVSDLYQGSELWNLSLVDPDNRAPIDFAERRRALGLVRERVSQRRLGSLAPSVGDPQLNRELLARYRDGWVKLYVLHLALLLRKSQRELFLFGDYDPLPAGEHVVAFTRAFERQRLVCAVTRLPYKLTAGARPFALGDVWRDELLTGMTPGRYLNVLDGRTLEVTGELPLRQLFATLPVALLTREPEGADAVHD